MNFSYSFSVPESLFGITLIAAAMFFAICILTLIDTWREIRDRRRQKKNGMHITHLFSTKKK